MTTALIVAETCQRCGKLADRWYLVEATARGDGAFSGRVCLDCLRALADRCAGNAVTSGIGPFVAGQTLEPLIHRAPVRDDGVNYDVLPEYREPDGGGRTEQLPPLSRDETLVRLRELAAHETSPEGHSAADDVIERFLRAIGETDVADAYAAVGKWFD